MNNFKLLIESANSGPYGYTGLKWAIQGKSTQEKDTWTIYEIFDDFQEAKKIWDDNFSQINNEGDYQYRLVAVNYDSFGTYLGVEEEYAENHGYGESYKDELKEEVIENIMEEPIEGAQEGLDTGIASMLNDLIIDEWQTINKYNSVIATLKSECPESAIINILNDIVTEELVHVGQLQVALESVAPNTEGIALGQVEADQQLDTEFKTEEE